MTTDATVEQGHRSGSKAQLGFGKPRYVGRFAPSPSGPLHFGSLVAALASYLDAKANCGQWLLRIDDLDPPREQAGAADDIRRCLMAHGLRWDGGVCYQSQRHRAYERVLSQLSRRLYACTCNRKRLLSLPDGYDGYCFRMAPVPDRSPFALRLHRNHDTWDCFDDRLQGQQKTLLKAFDDTVLKRKDGLYSYQLAVVVDDLYQGVTHVVRGADLLPTTARQNDLYRELDAKVPSYLHVPVVLGDGESKLSKQNHAPALDTEKASQNLWHGLNFLGLDPPDPLKSQSVDQLLLWGAEHWRIKALPTAMAKPYGEFR